jgi:hypothetical protein
MNFSRGLRIASIAVVTAGMAITAGAQGSGFMTAGAAGSGSNGEGSKAKSAGNAAKHKTDAPTVGRSFATEVRNGILTVDGMVGKAQMNYDIHQAYLYFTVPGVGTAIVSQTRFLNALPQKGAFHGNVLTVTVNGHVVELTSDAPLLKEKTAEAWVNVDPLFGAAQFPQMGFGDTTQRPYVWPGSKTVKAQSSHAYVKAPPLPMALRPKPEVASSYTVVVPPSQVDGAKKK